MRACTRARSSRTVHVHAQRFGAPGARAPGHEFKRAYLKACTSARARSMILKGAYMYEFIYSNVEAAQGEPQVLLCGRPIETRRRVQEEFVGRRARREWVGESDLLRPSNSVPNRDGKDHAVKPPVSPFGGPRAKNQTAVRTGGEKTSRWRGTTASMILSSSSVNRYVQPRRRFGSLGRGDRGV